MANDKYILSNDYYVEIEKLGPRSQAVLYSPSGSQLNKGEPSISASILTLIKEIIKCFIYIYICKLFNYGLINNWIIF